MARKDDVLAIANNLAEKPDVMATYNGETVLDIDSDEEMLITMQGSEHMGEYEFEEVNWDEVFVYKKVL